MGNKPQNGLRLLTHVFGEVLIVFGSIVVTLSITGNLNSNPYLVTGITSIIIGAFCQWNPV